MKSLLLNLMILCFVFNLSAQITFDKGYYINNSGDTVNCFIKDMEWRNTPTSFKYKLTPESEVKEAFNDNVTEFAIGKHTKYINAMVEIDRSSNDAAELSAKRNPEFNTEQLYLKVLVEGEATLYEYLEGSLTRYFFRLPDTEIKQLVCRQYVMPDFRVVENNYYKQQLMNRMRKAGFEVYEFNSLSYSKKALMRLFLKYNSAVNSVSVVFKRSNSGVKPLRFSVKVGAGNSQLKINNSEMKTWKTDFESMTLFRPAFEVEYTLPFNKNKWAIFLSPTYQSYSSKVNKKFSTTASVKYNSIDLPVGIRYYMFLKNDSKLFINGFAGYDVSFNSVIKYPSLGNDMEVSPTVSLGLGIGYQFKEKYSAAIEYSWGREIMRDYAKWTSDYNVIAFSLGYTLFKM